MAARSSARSTPAPSPQLDADAVRVLRRFRVVFNAVKTHFRTVERQAKLSGAQVWALSVVRDQPGIGVSGLAKAMDVHQSTASNLLRPLQEAGMVVADRTGTDKRTVQLKVTAAGTRALRNAPAPFAGMLPQALASLDAATLKRLDRDLGRVIEVLGLSSDGARTPMGTREP